MFKKISAAYPLDDLQLLVWFTEGEAKIYDMLPLVERFEEFAPLRDRATFERVRVDAGGYGLSWTDEIDIAGNELYAHGIAVDVIGSEKARIIAEVAAARKQAALSQTAVGEAAGIKQPVIARAESGETAPQLDTLLRMLAPLGKTLKVIDLPERTDYALTSL